MDQAPRGFALMDRIDPHEHAVRREELLAHLVGEFLVIDRGLGVDAGRLQFFEDAMEAVVLRRCVAPGLRIAAPDDRDFIGLVMLDFRPSMRNLSKNRVSRSAWTVMV